MLQHIYNPCPHHTHAQSSFSFLVSVFTIIPNTKLSCHLYFVSEWLKQQYILIWHTLYLGIPSFLGCSLSVLYKDIRWLPVLFFMSNKDYTCSAMQFFASLSGHPWSVLKVLGSVLAFVHLHFYPKCLNLSLLEILLMVVQQTSPFTPFQLLQCCGLKQMTGAGPLIHKPLDMSLISLSDSL